MEFKKHKKSQRVTEIKMSLIIMHQSIPAAVGHHESVLGKLSMLSPIVRSSHTFSLT